MKLTIKNIKKIEGMYDNLSIINTEELSDYYVFSVMRDNSIGSIKEVYLKRNGRVDEDGDLVFHFGRGSHNTQSVTAKWFQIISNAIDTILNEYETL